MDPITMAMLEEAATAFMKDQAVQAMGPEVAAMGGGNAVGGLLGQTQTGMATAPADATAPPPPPPPPPSMVDTLQTNVMSDINKSPYGQAYNTFTNPNATATDYTNLGYKVAFSPEAEKQNQMSMGQMPSMPMGGGYSGGRVSTVGGIPDLLKKYGDNSGLLQYLG
jgi:hypothetical protein